MKKILFLIPVIIITLGIIAHGVDYVPDGCLKFGSNGAEYCDDEKDYTNIISNGGSYIFHVNQNGGGTFFIAEASEMDHCQDFGNFGNNPPFSTIKKLSASDDGASVTLPPSSSGTYTVGTYGGNANQAYLCPGGDGSDAGSGPETATSQTTNTQSESPTTEPLGVCTTDIDLDCRRSGKVTSEACKSVVSPLQESTACRNQQITLNYNTQTLECGDELGLRIAKYDGAGGWTPLPDSNVISDGDGTGSVSAIINSDGIFAVVSTSECVPECYDNVYDYPDPVLGGNSITLGACGAVISEETEQQTTTETIPEETCFEKLGRLKTQGIVGSELYWQRCENSCNGENYGPTSDTQYCCANGCSGSESTYTTSSQSFPLPDLDTLAPALFIIRKAECTNSQGITSSDQEGSVCPRGYDYSGSFRIGNEEDQCNSDQTYTGIAKTSNGYTISSITKGWIDLCTKNNIAYLEKARDECLVEPFNFDLSNPSINSGSVLSAGYNVATLYCPEGEIICGGNDAQNVEGQLSRRNSFPGIFCCSANIQTSDTGDNKIAPSGQLTSAYCTEENSIATGARFGPNFEDENEADQLYCSTAQNAKIVYSDRKQLQSVVSDNLFCQQFGPDYAVCGGANNANTGSALDIGTLYCCQIKPELTACREGYTLVNTIKVNNEDVNRCNAEGPSSVHGKTSEGLNIISGHIGLCVKTSEIENFNQPLIGIPETVETGNVAPQNAPEGTIQIGKLTSEANYEQAIFPTLSSNDEQEEATISSGSIGFYVKENKPLVSFCATAEFNEGTCTEELCTDTSGTFLCNVLTQVEDAVQNYYAYICDFTGCPSETFVGTNNYYGTGNYQVCSSSESCGLLGLSTECTDLDQDGYCSDVDCDDSSIEVNPGAGEVCDGKDNDCDTKIDEDFDLDEDGVATCGTNPDCDDNNATISPTAGETCGNQIDENCDGEILECPVCENDGVDIDEDGYCNNNGDCNDANNTIFPNATEFCNDGIDQDCNGIVDDCPPTPQCSPGVYRTCYPQTEDYIYTYHQQCQEDEQWGTCIPDYELGIPPLQNSTSCTDGAVLSCPRQYGVCAGSKQTCTGNSWQGCSYANIAGYSLTDTCGDFLDNNCDGSVDEGCSCIETQTISCGSNIGTCQNGIQTCTNAKWGQCEITTGPIPEYLLDQQDNDCDGSIDEGFDCSQTFGLGFNRTCGQANAGICTLGIQTCSDKIFDGLTVLSACVGSTNPGQEICDSLDNNCDGSIDENCACIAGQTQTCGIGVGVCGTGHQDCINNTWSACLDVTAPQNEICGDELDNDCDGSVDEGCPCTGNQTSILCTKQAGVCNGLVAQCINGKFQDCNALYEALDDYQVIETLCSDGLDNDCDNSTDGNDVGACVESSTKKCSDGTPIGQCANEGTSDLFCNSLGNLVPQCSKCNPKCETGISVCNINGDCRDLPTPGTKPGGDNGGNQNTCNNNGICDIGETTNCSDCSISGSLGDKDNNGLPWLWIILGILLLLLIIGGAYYYQKKKVKKIEQKKLTPNQIQTIERPAITQEQLKQTKQENDVRQLQEYITRSLSQGKKINDIKELCKKAGWNEQEVNNCLTNAQKTVKQNPEQTLQDLETYAIASFRKGKSDQDIKKKLAAAGWKSDLIDKAVLNAKITLARSASINRPSNIAHNQDEEKYAEKKLNEMLDKEDTKNGLKTTTIDGKKEYILTNKKKKKAKKK